MEIINHLYVYCTDFIINLANMFVLSYYEINFLIFIVAYPILFIGALVFFFWQKLRLRSLNKTFAAKKSNFVST